MNTHSKGMEPSATADICILGAGGFIGRNLAAFFGARAIPVSRSDCNLLEQSAVDAFFSSRSFKVVFHCAVRGGSRLALDGPAVAYDNLLMLETVVKHANKFEKLVYFSSGARFDRSSGEASNIPSDVYGFSKYVIEKRAESVPNMRILRIYGCFGVGEPATRFPTICTREKHVVIEQDCYFDFVWVRDVCRAAEHYATVPFSVLPLTVNLVYRDKVKLSDVAKMAGASFDISQANLGLPYTGTFDADFLGLASPGLLQEGLSNIAAYFAARAS